LLGESVQNFKNVFFRVFESAPIFEKMNQNRATSDKINTFFYKNFTGRIFLLLFCKHFIKKSNCLVSAGETQN
jgi:hypothetical protein